jgi:hypothetical protein
MVAVCTFDGVARCRWVVERGKAIAHQKYPFENVPEETRAKAVKCLDIDAELPSSLPEPERLSTQAEVDSFIEVVWETSPTSETEAGLQRPGTSVSRSTVGGVCAVAAPCRTVSVRPILANSRFFPAPPVTPTSRIVVIINNARMSGTLRLAIRFPTVQPARKAAPSSNS